MTFTLLSFNFSLLTIDVPLSGAYWTARKLAKLPLTIFGFEFCIGAFTFAWVLQSILKE